MSDLDVRLRTEDGDVHAVRGLSFDVRAGEVLAIVGESGSGKSAASLAVLGLLPKKAPHEPGPPRDRWLRLPRRHLGRGRQPHG